MVIQGLILPAYAPTNIEYVKDSGDRSLRTIISTTEFPRNLRAADITELNEDEKSEMVSLFKEYDEYVHQHMSKMFSFNDWAEHTTGHPVEVKWRTFKQANTVVV